MDNMTETIMITNSDLYRKAKNVMLSCTNEEQLPASNNFIELSKKRYIKMFTKGKDCISIETIETVFNLLKYFKNYNY